MPNTRSAAKRMRSSQRKRSSNRAAKSELGTYERRLKEAIEGGDADRVASAQRRFSSALDKAAKRGVIHSNKADRKKSRSQAQVARSRTSAA